MIDNPHNNVVTREGEPVASGAEERPDNRVFPIFKLEEFVDFWVLVKNLDGEYGPPHGPAGTCGSDLATDDFLTLGPDTVSSDHDVCLEALAIVRLDAGLFTRCVLKVPDHALPELNLDA